MSLGFTAVLSPRGDIGKHLFQFEVPTVESRNEPDREANKGQSGAATEVLIEQNADSNPEDDTDREIPSDADEPDRGRIALERQSTGDSGWFHSAALRPETLRTISQSPYPDKPLAGRRGACGRRVQGHFR